MLRPKHDIPRGLLHFKSSPSMSGHWRYWPSADLAEFVEHYWTVRWDVPEPQIRETLPHPSVHIVLENGLAQLAGVATGKFTRVLEGKGRVVSVKFRPGGFRAFVEQPVANFTNRVLPLTDVFGAAAAGLGAQALAHEDHEAAMVVVESFLRDRRPQADPAIGFAGRIAECIATDRTIVKVEHVARRFGINSRKLQRLFSEYIGVSPKWVIQRYRLHEAAERLASAAVIDWADIALELGYADQAHFIRDFKKLVGRSPADYVRTLASPR